MEKASLEHHWSGGVLPFFNPESTRSPSGRPLKDMHRIRTAGVAPESELVRGLGWASPVPMGVLAANSRSVWVVDLLSSCKFRLVKTNGGVVSHTLVVHVQETHGGEGDSKHEIQGWPGSLGKRIPRSSNCATFMTLI